MFEINDFVIIIGFIFSWILFSSSKNIKPNKLTPQIKISIVIPVRNEEHNICKLLSDIKKQTYEIFEIICVDDESQDRTCELIEEFDVELISSGNLPEGWRGKAWACQQGAKHAKGNVLLFLDADVSLHENAVEALASNFALNNSCISVQPYHKTKKAYEQLSLFFNTIQAIATGMGLPFKACHTGLFGPLS